MKNFALLCGIFGTLFFSSLALAEKIINLRAEGNLKVEEDAITGIMSSKVGEELDQTKVQKDILALYDIGYFSDVRVYEEPANGGVTLIVWVQEKPAITSIDFVGLKELEKEELEKTLETKLYTIVNEGTISRDVINIEKKYIEKGLYLTAASYTLKQAGENEVHLTYNIDESGKVLVGDVVLLGNHHFSNTDILEKLASRPYNRMSAGLGAPSTFQDDAVDRDHQFLQFYYKDQGFAEVKVDSPLVVLDPDKRFVRITFKIEEGIQYRIGSIKVSGDIGPDLYSAEDLLAKMTLKDGELFRYSFFSKDIEVMGDMYGDLGYAYADINPQTTFDKENKVVHIVYQITKGQKVYFGQIDVIGNTKTRDNVIRREISVFDTDLYSGTSLTKSKDEVSRLGYFEQVQVLKERDEKAQDVLNLKFKVKEKPTGQLQASAGYSPNPQETTRFFVQGRYEEQNQSGFGINTNLNLKWGGDKSYEVMAGFVNPKINDGPWSWGANAVYQRKTLQYLDYLDVTENRLSFSTNIGRQLFEEVRGALRLTHTRINLLENEAELELLENYNRNGTKNSAGFILSRKVLDNNLDPSSGSDVFLSHQFSGGLLGGNSTYMESSFDGVYYHPLNFNEDFRTYFKFRGVVSKLWEVDGRDVPPNERYRLGGFDLRGFKGYPVGPKTRRGRGVLDSNVTYNYGGDRQAFCQLEYLIPLIGQAGIKGVLFTDFGKVFSDHAGIEEERFISKDIGFGLRWITPIAPFRFEWAYPYDDEKKAFGEANILFNIGY